MARLNWVGKTTPSAWHASSVCTSPWSPPSSAVAVRLGPYLLTLRKGSRLLRPHAWRNFFLISYLEHKTNDWVWNKTNFFVGPQEPLLATDKRQKQTWFWYITHYDSLSETNLEGILEDGQCWDRQKKWWMDNIKEWMSLPCQNCSWWPLTEKTRRWSVLMNHSSWRWNQWRIWNEPNFIKPLYNCSEPISKVI